MESSHLSFKRTQPNSADPRGSADRRALETMLREVGPEAARRVEAYEEVVGSVLPVGTPYWYLGILARHPTRAGSGYGRAVMQAGLEHVRSVNGTVFTGDRPNTVDKIPVKNEKEVVEEQSFERGERRFDLRIRCFGGQPLDEVRVCAHLCVERRARMFELFSRVAVAAEHGDSLGGGVILGTAGDRRADSTQLPGVTSCSSE